LATPTGSGKSLDHSSKSGVSFKPRITASTIAAS